MKVVVTGGSGLVGRFTIAELLEHGYEVRSVDKVRPQAPQPEVEFWQVDVTDVGQVFNALQGADAVIHLAAIPSPHGYPPHTVFYVDTMSTYNVLEACRILGIRKVAMASSVNAIGLSFSREIIKPDYLPIDEEHPPRPEDCYSLAKLVGEVMGDAFARLVPQMTLASLRFHGVSTPERYEEWRKAPKEEPWANAKHLWGYVDARDVARSCRLAIEADYRGHEAFFIVASDTRLNIPTRELLRTCFPNVPLKKELGEFEGLFNCAKAERILGWKPLYSWRT